MDQLNGDIMRSCGVAISTVGCELMSTVTNGVRQSKKHCQLTSMDKL